MLEKQLFGNVIGFNFSMRKADIGMVLFDFSVKIISSIRRSILCPRSGMNRNLDSNEEINVQGLVAKPVSLYL